MNRKVTTVVAALALGAILGSPSRPNSPPALADEDVELSGSVTAWHIDSRGVVSFRLRPAASAGQDPDGEDVWIRTPANQSGSTRLEDLVLETVLRIEESGRLIHVRAESSGSETGEDPASALSLLSIQSHE